MNFSLRDDGYLTVQGFMISPVEPCIVEQCLAEWPDEVTRFQLYYFDIAYWIWAFVILLLGIPMNFGIVHYEWFGGDPQKRSLTNRIISSYVIANTTAGVTMHIFTAAIRSVMKANFETKAKKRLKTLL